MPASLPVCLTLAGFDTSGGAGVPADLRVFSHFGCHGLAALTSVVAESPTVVEAVEPLPPAFVARQLRLMLELYPVAALKTGMLPDAATVEAILPLLEDAVRRRGIPLVVDPVMIASTGDALVEADAVQAMRARLFPLATVLTPNLDEAAHLAGPRLHDFEQPAELAAFLQRDLACHSLLLKGGHFPGETVFDLLATASGVRVLQAPRIHTPASHGTGCALSAALTARLALGDDLPAAVATARHFIRRALAEPLQFQRENQPAQHHLGPVRSA